jgi:Subtilase family
MRSPKILCILILAVLGGIVPSRADSQRRDGRQRPPIVLESAEVKWQVVALRRKAADPCPEVSGWTVANWLDQALLEPGQKHDPKSPAPDWRRDQASGPLLRELGLDRFCSYRATASPPRPFPQPLPAGLESATNSRMALVPTGDLDPGPADPVEILARHFLEQTSGMPVAGVAPEKNLGGPVRLVFLDTQPDGEGVPRSSGPSRHGYTLVHLAEQLTCSGVAHCPVELATRLALPHSTFSPEVPPADYGDGGPGGDLGLVDELAAAIVREIWNWRRSGSRQHLILNLSVGWDGELPGELGGRRGSPLKTDARLVYDALQLAHRSGALVIAAAGNRRGGGESNWPLLPAAWELYRPSGLPRLLGPRPVYAVGGVDWQGLPLPNYRRGGMPRRVAFGDHAVVLTAGLDKHTDVYTGTSVSTAVVSSIAAVVWHLRPELGAAEVMRLVGRSGDPLPSRADYYAWKHLWPLSRLRKAPDLRRLSLCPAVAQACRGGRCAAPSCHLWEPTRHADLSPLGFVATLPLPAPRAASLPALCEPASRPAPRFFTFGEREASTDPTAAGESSCPLYLLPDMVSQRWVCPQPEANPCPGCTFVPPPSGAMASTASPSGYVLAVEIDPEWQRSTRAEIKSATLDVDRYDGGRLAARTTYNIPADELLAAGAPGGTHRLLLNGIGGGRSLAGCTATLNFEVSLDGRSYSIQSPVYVDP